MDVGHHVQPSDPHMYKDAASLIGAEGGVDNMKGWQMRLGQVVRKARHDRNLTLKQLQAKTGIWFNKISEIEAGKNINPGWRTVKKLAHALDLKLDKIDQW